MDDYLCGCGPLILLIDPIPVPRWSELTWDLPAEAALPLPPSPVAAALGPVWKGELVADTVP